MPHHKITISELREGLDELEALAREEYRQGLSEILKDEDPKTRLRRLGRLIGVTIREPFGPATALDDPTPITHAYRRWDLSSESSFYRSGSDIWQYTFLAHLLDEEWVRQELYAGDLSPYGLARLAHERLGFFGLLVLTSRKQLCKKSKVRQRIEMSFRKLGPEGCVAAPDAVLNEHGAQVATILVQRVPGFGHLGPGAIAGFVLMLGAVGIEKFCAWVKGDGRSAEWEHER
jgi:hypothetical protein